MRVRVQVFASFREAVGARAVELELDERPTVRELLTALRARHPGLGPALESAMVAVNLEYVGPDFELHEGDEVGLIPPVSGGADLVGALLAAPFSLRHGNGRSKQRPYSSPHVKLETCN